MSFILWLDGSLPGATAEEEEGGTSSGTTDTSGPTNTNATEVPSNYLICDFTGFKIEVKEGLHTDPYSKFRVRRESIDIRNQQEFVKGRGENLKGSVRPEQQDRFIETQVTQDDL